MGATDGRVLVLTSTFPARPGDGTPGFVLSLAEELARTRPVSVVAPRTRGSVTRERIGAVEVVRFRYFPRRWEGLADGAIMPTLRAEPWRLLEVPPFLAAYLWTAWREARRLRPAVVNAHWVLPAGVVALVLRRLGGPPYVLTAHGADAFVLATGWPARLKRRVLARAAAVLPVSEDIATTLRALGASCPSVVPMGVDVAAIREATTPRRPEPGRLLFVGRLAGKKGVPVLLEAMVGVPGTTLTLLGDGPDRSAIEARIATLGLAGRVEVLGQQPRARVEAELRRATALVIPSVVDTDGDKDGTPVVLPEALAAEVPVVASDLAGLGEHLVDDVNGILVPPGDVAALTTALARVVADPESLVGLATEGLATARQRFDLPVIAAAYHAAFEAVPR
jgi:glycosyltransferase involved in cell wall biosynthesis